MAPGAEASRRAVAGAMAADRGLPETARAGLGGEGGENEKPGNRRWRLLAEPGYEWEFQLKSKILHPHVPSFGVRQLVQRHHVFMAHFIAEVSH